MTELNICALQKTTLLDYPGLVAATIFMGGCNFRCPFCHNSRLLEYDAKPLCSQEEVLAFLKKRSNILEGVCITGGEPTLQPEALEIFMGHIRSLGLKIKLDTNGSRPKTLRRLLEAGLIDYIAMDIKASPNRYALVCGLPSMELSPIQESVDWLKQGSVDYEFRTTAVKGLHCKEDFAQIGSWIAGCPRYYLQNYADSGEILCPDQLSSFSKEELLQFADIVRPYVGNVDIRGANY